MKHKQHVACIKHELALKQHLANYLMLFSLTGHVTQKRQPPTEASRGVTRRHEVSHSKGPRLKSGSFLVSLQLWHFSHLTWRSHYGKMYMEKHHLKVLIPKVWSCETESAVWKCHHEVSNSRTLCSMWTRSLCLTLYLRWYSHRYAIFNWDHIHLVSKNYDTKSNWSWLMDISPKIWLQFRVNLTTVVI